MDASKIMCQHFYDGDIVITDPMYIINNDLKSTDIEKPKWDDYFPRSQYTPKMLEDPIILHEYQYCQPKYQKAYNDWVNSQTSDWELTDYGNDLSCLGFSSHMVFPTEYGCWSCTIFDDMKESIRRCNFFSDSGLFGVFELKEIRAYNPKFKIKAKDSFSGIALIPKFKGQIFIVNKTQKPKFDADIRIIGVGTTNFHSRQTGF